MPRKHFTRSREDRKALMSFACSAALHASIREEQRWRHAMARRHFTQCRQDRNDRVSFAFLAALRALIVFALLAVSRAIYPGGGRTPAFRVVNGGRHAMAGRHFT
jgi:hypothetical protein